MESDTIPIQPSLEQPTVVAAVQSDLSGFKYDESQEYKNFTPQTALWAERIRLGQVVSTDVEGNVDVKNNEETQVRAVI